MSDALTAISHLSAVRSGALVVVAASAGAATALGPADALTAATGCVAVAVAVPLLLVGVTVGEQWPLAFALPGGAGEAIVAVALAGALGFFLRYIGRRQVCDLRRLAPGHLAMALILALALVNSAFVPGSVSSFAILTSLAAVPIGLVGASLSRPDVPLLWLVVVAPLPLLVAAGVVTDSSINPIGIGNVSWAAAYFAFVLRNRIPRPFVVAAILAGGYQVAILDHLGPKVAAGATLLTAALQHSKWTSRSRPRTRHTSSSRALGRLLVSAGLLLAAAGVGGALAELGADDANNTNIRREVWAETIRGATLTGQGIVNVEAEVAGADFRLSNHNFVLDTITGAGWVGLVLMAYIVARSFAAVRRSSHPLVPYCVGVIVANSVSGGLFRSPSLWLALAFLIAEAKSYDRHTDSRLRPGSPLLTHLARDAAASHRLTSKHWPAFRA